MNYVGVDAHKKYSVLCALDEGGPHLEPLSSLDVSTTRKPFPMLGLACRSWPNEWRGGAHDRSEIRIVPVGSPLEH
jgi:hypothetical protein